jgi:hypothetical protein
MTREFFLKTLTDKLEWYHVGLTKWAAMFFLLFVLTVWPAAREFLLSVAWQWYLTLCLAISIPIIVTMISPAKPRKRAGTKRSSQAP